MESVGTEIIGDLKECDGNLLLAQSPEKLKEAVSLLIKKFNLQELGSYYHSFDVGLTGVIALAESHVTFHTWPNEKYVSINVFVCNHSKDNSPAGNSLFSELTMLFKPGRIEKQIIRDLPAKPMITAKDVKQMGYVDLMALLNEVNRPPGGKDSIRRIVQNTFLQKDSRVLDVGCNTGYSSFEIAHIAKCSVIGVDINPQMIRTANRFKSNDSYQKLVNFRVADGMKLPFKDNEFDLTVSGGSTAFIEDKVRALQEYARVTKRWGFIADINFFYKKEVPQKLIRFLNDAMEINIQPWKQDYWTDIYKKTGLETYHTYVNKDVRVPSKKEIAHYCDHLSNNIDTDMGAQKLIQKRLIELMSIFSENHKYLAYGVFILRKRDYEEQPALFGL